MALTQVQTGMISGVPIQVSTNGVITTINANNTPVITSNGNTSSIIAGNNTFITSNGTTTTISANNASAINIDAFQNSTFANTVKTNTISSTPTNALNIQTAGTTAVTIDTSQNVGIGAYGTNSGRALQVSQPGGYSAGIRIIANSTGGDNAALQFFANGSTSQWTIGAYTASPNQLQFRNNGTLYCYADNSGNWSFTNNNNAIQDGWISWIYSAISSTGGCSSSGPSLNFNSSSVNGSSKAMFSASNSGTPSGYTAITDQFGLYPIIIVNCSNQVQSQWTTSTPSYWVRIYVRSELQPQFY